MNFLVNIVIVLITIAGMEAFSWGIHKYLFHGPLWFIHKTHHHPSKSPVELNDLFSLSFAAVSLWLLWLGRPDLDYRFWIGAGISFYGIIYFIFHDGFIHNRFKIFKSGNRYLSGIQRAHKIHHKSLQKFPSSEFGLLTASRKYFRK